MKRIFLVLLLSISFAANAVDITITATAGQANRAAAAVGKLSQLVDAKGVPRDATLPEVKQFLINYLRMKVHEVEGAAMLDAAQPTLKPPAFDPT